MFKKNIQKKYLYFSKVKGFSLVEILFVISITVLIFFALFTSFEYSLRLMTHSRAKITALSLASDRMEFIRSLPYTQVGTIAGIPNGPVPQNRVVTLNGIDFNERVLIEYFDDPADGMGDDDINGIITDYKKVKVEYTWNVHNESRSISLISNIIPVSIETDVGGGTIRVNVISSLATPLSGISVRLKNDTATSTIDVTRTTNSNGVALFTGAPAISDYEVEVFSPGFSTDGTIVPTVSLPMPASPPFSVAEASISTVNFMVDRLSDLEVKVFDEQTDNIINENFDNLALQVSSSSVEINTDSIVLTEIAGVYDPAGSVIFGPYNPSPLESWLGLIVDSSLSANTGVRVRFYSDSSLSLIDESVLPGNIAGFAINEINLTNLDKFVYPTLYIGLFLTTTDSSFTPIVNNFQLHYTSSRDYLDGVSVNLVGNRTIGQDSTFSYVYKNILSTTTNSNGVAVFDQIEQDNYTMDVTGFRINSACPNNPFNLVANTSSKVNLKVGLTSPHNMRVSIYNSSGNAIYGADVTLSRGGSVYNSITDWCGNAYFSGVPEAIDYVLEVSKSGYSDLTQTDVSVSGQTDLNYVLTL